MKYAILVSLLILTACTTASTKFEAYCPPLKTYTKEFNKKLADEVEKLPPGAALETAMIDYANQRDRIRRCMSERNKV
jgi:Tfp pilus assembly protein PilP